MSLKQKILTLACIFTTGYLLIALVRYVLADYFYSQKDYERAIALSSEPLYKIGYAAQLPSNAVSLLEKASSASPRNIKLLKSISLTYSDLAENNPEYLGRENEVLMRLRQLAPTDPWVTYQLTLNYLKLGHKELAKKTLLKTLELKPDYEKAKSLHATFGILQI